MDEKNGCPTREHDVTRDYAFFLPLRIPGEGHSSERLNRVRIHMNRDEVLQTITLAEAMDAILPSPSTANFFPHAAGDKYHCSDESCLEKEIISPLKACGGCKLAWYCKRDYQVADWREHKKVCKVVHEYTFSP